MPRTTWKSSAAIKVFIAIIVMLLILGMIGTVSVPERDLSKRYIA